MAEVDAALAAIIEPQVQHHLDVYSDALRRVREFHTEIADRTDLDLRGKTRPAAIWQVMGRTLALAEATVWLHHAGFGLETMPTDRALYEASMLLWVVTLSQNQDLIRRWLSDERWIRPAEIRTEATEIEQRENASRLRAGEVPLSQIWQEARVVYGGQSAIAHHRRLALDASVSANLRRMPTGPQPNPGIGASLLYATGAVVTLGVDVACVATARFFGASRSRHLSEIADQLWSVKQKFPLDVETTTNLQAEFVLRHLASDPNRPKRAEKELDEWDALRRGRGLAPVARVARE